MKNEVKAAMKNEVKAAKKDIIRACIFYCLFRNSKRTRTKVAAMKQVATTLAMESLSLQAEVASVRAEMADFRVRLAIVEWQQGALKITEYNKHSKKVALAEGTIARDEDHQQDVTANKELDKIGSKTDTAGAFAIEKSAGI